MRKYALLFSLLILACTLLVVHADTIDEAPVWQAWMYDRAGHLELVDGNGEVLDRVTLPVRDDFRISEGISVSTDGELIGYIESVRCSGGSVCERYLNIYDTTEREVIVSLPQNVWCATATCNGEASSIIFSLSGDKIAYRERTEQADVTHWRIVVYDLLRQTQIASISTEDAFFAENIAPEPEVRFISVRYLAGNFLTFNVFVQNRNDREEPAYLWDMTTNQLSRTYAFLNNTNSTDIFRPTGEVLIAYLSPGSTDIARSLSVYDPVTRSRFVFFETPEDTILRADFVANGEFVLASLQLPRTDSTEESYEALNTWWLLRRDGTIALPLGNMRGRFAMGVADGFIYTYYNLEREATELVHYNTSRLFSDTTVWMSEGNWQLEWADSGTLSYGPFIPWAQLGEPMIDPPLPVPQVEIQPTGFPTPAPILYVGRIVEVNTIDGEVLYLRDEPSTTGTILLNLLDRMVLEIIGGPIEAEGYVWWQVVNEDGLEGWAAQAVDNVSTLLPR